MKINYVSGCICDSLTIDNIESIDLPIETIKDAITKALSKINDIAVLQNILMTIAETGDYKDLGHCEDCGDYIVEYTIEV